MATGGNVPDPNKPKTLKAPVKKPAKPAPKAFTPKGKK